LLEPSAVRQSPRRHIIGRSYDVSFEVEPQELISRVWPDCVQEAFPAVDIESGIIDVWCLRTDAVGPEKEARRMRTDKVCPSLNVFSDMVGNNVPGQIDNDVAEGRILENIPQHTQMALARIF
jgi:hypothetical protein